MLVFTSRTTSHTAWTVSAVVHSYRWWAPLTELSLLWSEAVSERSWSFPDSSSPRTSRSPRPCWSRQCRITTAAGTPGRSAGRLPRTCPSPGARSADIWRDRSGCSSRATSAGQTAWNRPSWRALKWTRRTTGVAQTCYRAGGLPRAGPHSWDEKKIVHE